VDEQVEEEASADAVVQDLRRAGDSQQLLFMLDRELGGRTLEAEGETEEG
jgi:ferritin